MNERDDRALRGVRLWLDVATLSTLTDHELLARFVDADGHAAQVAFAALVARHGPMVLHACHAVLGDAHAAEDAFQATFLVLARRGGSVWLRGSLGPWLHRVASRASARLRNTTVRRSWHERKAAETRAESHESVFDMDVGPIVHAEIDRLPDRYRGPVVLCDLEGLTHAEAAARLGCPIGTVKSRLSRAHEWLRDRLEQRGLAPALGGLGTLLAGHTATAVPPTLAHATVGAAGGGDTAGTVPAAVVTLAEGVVRAMSLNKLAMRFAALLVGVLATTGVLVLAADRPSAVPGTRPEGALIAAAAPVPPENPVPKDLQPFQGVWSIGLCDTANQTLYANNAQLGKWRWTVKGDEIVWALKGEEWKLKLHVDPGKSPKELDLTYLSGPFEGKKCLGMFEWGGVDGKTLQIAIQDPGATVARPTKLEMTGSSQTGLIFLRRIEPVDPKKELAVFQGTWSFDNVMTDVWPRPIGKAPDQNGQGGERRWIVAGNEIAWTGVDGNEVKMSFTIDPHKVPRQIDATFLSGPNKGVKCLGVYEWTGEKLWICFADPGRMIERPKEMSYATNQGRTWIFLSRHWTPAEIEHRALQGVWKFEMCQSEWWPARRAAEKGELSKWRWMVKGTEMSWTGAGIDDVTVSFTVEPAKSPKEIDLTFLVGPNKGEKCRGIYKLKGGSLWLCVQDPGTKGERPTDFDATAKGRSLLILDPAGEKK